MPKYEIDTKNVYVPEKKVTFDVRLYTEEDRRQYRNTDHGGSVTVGVPYYGDRCGPGTATQSIPLDAFEGFVYEHYGMRVSSSFDPDWASPPVDSFKDAMTSRELSVEDVAEKMGYTPERVKLLLEDGLRISEDVAERMALVAGSKGFWLRREANYLQSLARLAHKAAEECPPTPTMPSTDDIKEFLQTPEGQKMLSDASKRRFSHFVRPLIRDQEGATFVCPTCREESCKCLEG